MLFKKYRLKKLWKSYHMIFYLEKLVSEICNVNLKNVHNRIIINDAKIVNDPCFKKIKNKFIVVCYDDYLIVFMRHTFILSKYNSKYEKLALYLVDKYPDKFVKIIHLNFY